MFFDFSKAFDTVHHRLLMQKLCEYNVHPLMACALSLQAYTIYVCVNGASSDILPVTSRVPQGSVLGPLLFIVYINGITAVSLSEGSILLYVDDSMLYRPIHTVDNYDHLQLDINKLCSWTNDNLLILRSIQSLEV